MKFAESLFNREELIHVLSAQWDSCNGDIKREPQADVLLLLSSDIS